MSLYTKKSQINGKGLYTDQGIKKMERVGVIRGPIVIVHKFVGRLIQQSLNWIGVGRYSWIDTFDSPFRYINHSCEPNTYITGKRIVIALRDIQPDEELTMDYSLTEADPDYEIPGGCHCGTNSCRKRVGPVQSLTNKEYKKLKKIMPPKFQKIYEVERRMHRTPD